MLPAVRLDGSAAEDIGHGRSVAAAPGAVVPYMPYMWYRPWGFGFGFGPLFFLLLFFLVVRPLLWGGFYRRRWYYGHPYGPGRMEGWHGAKGALGAAGAR